MARWMEVFSHTHVLDAERPAQRIEWPDGRSYMDQPSVLTKGFGVIREEWVKACNKGNRHGK